MIDYLEALFPEEEEREERRAVFDAAGDPAGLRRGASEELPEGGSSGTTVPAGTVSAGAAAAGEAPGGGVGSLLRRYEAEYLPGSGRGVTALPGAATVQVRTESSGEVRLPAAAPGESAADTENAARLLRQVQALGTAGRYAGAFTARLSADAAADTAALARVQPWSGQSADPAALDRIFRRDARRYENEFTLYG